MKNGGKQASSYTVNLCRKEITLAQHAKVIISKMSLNFKTVKVWYIFPVGILSQFRINHINWDDHRGDTRCVTHPTLLFLGAVQQRILTPSNKIKIWKTGIWALCSSSTTWYPIKSWYFRNSWNRRYFWSGTSTTRIASFGSSRSRKSRWATFGCSATSCTSSRGRRPGIQIFLTA